MSTSRRLPSVRPGPEVILVLVAIAPIVIVTVRALTRGWVAAGDNGLILLRAQDVGTANHPLLGTWTSASMTAGRPINNPGPLWFDLLAPFVKVAGPSVGFAVGVMAANVGAVVLAAWAARRAGGVSGSLLVTALSAGLAWSMGSELLFDAWQPNAMILPCWAFLVAGWALSCGDLTIAPWIVGLASLIVQTHLSFVFVVGLVGAAAIVGAAVFVRRDHARDVEQQRSVRRAVITSLVVAVILWVQPVLDQLFGEQNLSSLLRSSNGDSERIGLRLGVRLIGSVVALPPWWTRSGYSGTIRPTPSTSGPGVVEGDVASFPVAAAALLTAVAVLIAVVVVGWRRRSRPTTTAGAVALVAVGACLSSMLLSPIGVIGLSPHQLRWLWPVSAFVLMAPLFAISGWAPARRPMRVVSIVAVCALSIMTLPTHAAPEGPTADRAFGPSVEALLDQVDDYDPDGPVEFDLTVLRFAEPYSGPLFAALSRNGVDVVVDDENMLRQIGARRRATGTEDARLVLLEGDATERPPEGARQIAFVDGLAADDRAELEDLRPDVVAAATRTGIELNEAGRDAVQDGQIGFAPAVLAAGDDATSLEEAGWISLLVNNDWIELDPPTAELFRRYAELADRASTYTVGLFEVPITEA